MMNLGVNENLKVGAEFQKICAADKESCSQKVYLQLVSLSLLPTLIIDLQGYILAKNEKFISMRESTDVVAAGPVFALKAREGQIQLLEFLKTMCSGGPDSNNVSQRHDIYVRAINGRSAFWMSCVKLSGMPHVAVTIYTPDLTSIDPERLAKRLQVLFELSKAEALTAVYLGKGLSAQDIASVREVSLPTVRTQLSAIRAKLGANTTLEAVAIITRLSLPL